MNLCSTIKSGIFIFAVASLAACDSAPSNGTGTPATAVSSNAQPAAAPPAPAREAAAAQFDPALPAMLQSPEAESAGECGIEATDEVPQGGTLTFPRDAVAEIQGWALAREVKGPAEGVFLKLASSGTASYFVPVTMVSRAGLGIRLGDPALDAAGFEVSAAFQHVPAGEYTVQVAQRIAGRVLLCATGRTLIVSQ